jgi:hypothetical protein
MNDMQPTPSGSQKAPNLSRQAVRQRIHRMKIAFTIAAMLLFGVLGFTIWHPDLGSVFSTTANQDTETNASDGTYFNGGSSNGSTNSTSSSTPVTSTQSS